MKIKNALFLSLFFINCNLFANKIQVQDIDSHEAIAGAKIVVIDNSIKSKDSIRIFYTNKTGNIKLTPYNNKYIKLIITCPGYNKKFDSLILDSDKTIALNKLNFILKDIVATGQFSPQSAQESIFQIQAINEEMIKAQASVNLKDLLSNQLNISIGQDNILGSNLSINGVSGQNVKILVDGVPVIGRLNGNIDISQINLNNAERVEIVQGPMSTIYGSDALGGVINIISKNKQSTDYGIAANSYYESIGVYNFDLNSHYQSGKFSSNISAGRNFFEGYSLENSSRFKEWKPKEQIFSNLNLNYKFDNYTLTYSNKIFIENIQNKGIPREPYFETALDEEYKTNRMDNSLNFKGMINENQFVDALISYSNYQRNRETYLKDLVHLVKINPNSTLEEFSNYDARASYSSDGQVKDLNYQVGLEFNKDKANGEKMQNANAEIQDLAAFMSIQYLISSSTLLQPSVRYAHNSKFDAPLIPSLHFKMKLSEELSLRASYSKGFRAPSLRELYFLFVDINHNVQGNENLKAETADAYNLSFEYNDQTNTKIFKIEPRFFYNNIKDQINLANISGPLYTYFNLGNFKTLGGDISLSYMREDLTAKIGFSLLGKKFQLDSQETNDKFVFSHEIQAAINYNFEAIDSRLSFFVKYNANNPTFVLNEKKEISQGYSESYTMMDFNISKDLLDKKCTLTCGVKNILDVNSIKSTQASAISAHNNSNNMNIAWGRTFFVSLKVNLEQK